MSKKFVSFYDTEKTNFGSLQSLNSPEPLTQIVRLKRLLRGVDLLFPRKGSSVSINHRRHPKVGSSGLRNGS